MVEESDGIEEAVDTGIRAAVTAGAQVAANVARIRELQDRAGHGASSDALSPDGKRAGTHRVAQRPSNEEVQAALKPVYQKDFWDRGDFRRIIRVYALARRNPEADPEALPRIRKELHDRYGIGQPGANVDRLEEAIEGRRSEQQQRIAEQERLRDVQAITTANQAEQAEAAAFAAAEGTAEPTAQANELTRADTEHDHATISRAEASRAYDSAERRADMAEELQQQGIDPVVVEERVRADTAQGRPATEITRNQPGRSSRKARAAGSRQNRSIEIHRDGPSR